MVQKFNAFIESKQLVENNLFSTPAEKDALTKDKTRVANAFLYNFFGMLGMINGVQQQHRATLLNSFKKDAKLQIGSIDDTNLDISLSVKLAHDAGFFITPNTVNEITRFLVKLKAGQITQVDSGVVGKWAAAIKPEFETHINDPVLRAAWRAYRTDEGKTLDSSYLTVVLKKQLNKNADTGDFGRYAKRFFGITQIPVTTAAVATPVPAAPGASSATVSAPPSVAPAATQPASVTPAAAQPAATAAAPQKLSYYQRQKLKKAQAAQTATAATPAQPPAPKLSYYQKQKAKRDAEKAALAAAAAAKAAAEAKAREEELAKKRAELEKAGVPAALWTKFEDVVWKIGAFNSFFLQREYRAMVNAGPSDPVPDKIEQLLDDMHNMSVAMDTFNPTRYSWPSLMDNNFYEKAVAQLVQAASKLQTHRPGESGNTYLLKLMQTVSDAIKNTPGGPGSNTPMPLRASHMFTSLWMAGELNEQQWRDLIVPIRNGFDASVFVTMYRRMPSRFQPKFAATLLLDLSDNQKTKFLMSSMFTEVLSAKIDHSTLSVTHDSYTVPLMDLVFNTMGIDWGDVINAYWNNTGYTWKKTEVVTYTLLGASTSWGFLDSVEPMTKAIQTWVKTKLPTEISNSALRGFFNDLLADTVLSWKGLAYDPSLPDKNGFLFRFIHDKFASEIEQNGYANSQFQKITGMRADFYNAGKAFVRLGVDLKKMLENRPADYSAISIAAKDNIANVNNDQIKIMLTTNPANPAQVYNGNNIAHAMKTLIVNVGGTPEETRNRIIKATADLYEQDDRLTNSPEFARLLLDHLPECHKEVTLQLMRAAMKKKDTMIMTYKTYQNLHKSNKQQYVDALQAIMQDAIGTDIEDHINDIMEELPQHVKQKIRENLVGASVVIEDIQKGDIKPFAQIDASRMKQILYYNDLNLSDLIPNLDKKRKGETFTDYFKRAKAAAAQAGLHPLKTKLNDDDTAKRKLINKVMVDQHHAGRHGDTYPLIHKVFDVNMTDPSFEQFKKTKPMDGNVVPAYHGTGGIAAAMILRYGFKVIKSTDPSVVGRMLGDGIYFSNKIDKSLQYVSNGGYGRQHGSKGYVLLMDVNLGTRSVDYQAAGIGGRDSIRSPEWCVFDPKTQTNVYRAYEVSLESRATVDRNLREDVEEMLGFKSFLKEAEQVKPFYTTAFVFRDGQIPIVESNGDVIYVDFEQALAEKLITPDMFDITRQGPAIVFDNTSEQAIYDLRAGRGLIGDELNLYRNMFIHKMQTTALTSS